MHPRGTHTSETHPTPRLRCGVFVLLAACLVAVSVPVSPAFGGHYSIVKSVSAGATGDSVMAVASDGASKVAFLSTATNLVPGAGGSADVFVRDTASGSVVCASRALGSGASDGDSAAPAISRDGRFVAFESAATNLVDGDHNSAFDVFVFDTVTSELTLVSASSAGGSANADSHSPSISGDGRLVAFSSMATNLVDGDTNGRSDVFVADLRDGTVVRVSTGVGGTEGDGDSTDPDISSDGLYVAFASRAGNLVSGDTNGQSDVFVRELASGATSRMSVGAPGLRAIWRLMHHRSATVAVGSRSNRWRRTW